MNPHRSCWIKAKTEEKEKLVFQQAIPDLFKADPRLVIVADNHNEFSGIHRAHLALIRSFNFLSLSKGFLSMIPVTI